MNRPSPSFVESALGPPSLTIETGGLDAPAIRSAPDSGAGISRVNTASVRFSPGMGTRRSSPSRRHSTASNGSTAEPVSGRRRSSMWASSSKKGKADQYFVSGEGKESSDFFHRLFPPHLNPARDNQPDLAERSTCATPANRDMRRPSFYRAVASLTIEEDRPFEVPRPAVSGHHRTIDTDTDGDGSDDDSHSGDPDELQDIDLHDFHRQHQPQAGPSTAAGGGGGSRQHQHMTRGEARRAAKKQEMDEFIEQVLARSKARVSASSPAATAVTSPAGQRRRTVVGGSLGGGKPGGSQPQKQLPPSGVAATAAIPRSLTAAQQTNLRRIFNTLSRVEDMQLSETVLNAASTSRETTAELLQDLTGGGGGGPGGPITGGGAAHTKNLGAIHQRMCTALEALWERYRVSYVERSKVRDAHFNTVSRDNFNAIAALVAKYAVAKAHGNHLLRLLHLREAALQSFLKAAADHRLNDDGVPIAEHESTGAYLFNLAAVLRHTTVSILRFVDFLRHAPGGASKRRSGTESATANATISLHRRSSPTGRRGGGGGSPPNRGAPVAVSTQRVRGKPDAMKAGLPHRPGDLASPPSPNASRSPSRSPTRRRGGGGLRDAEAKGTGDPEFDGLDEEAREHAVRALLDWEGECYLDKMQGDVDAVADTPLGAILSRRGFATHANPLLLPSSVVDRMSAHPGLCNNTLPPSKLRAVAGTPAASPAALASAPTSPARGPTTPALHSRPPPLQSLGTAPRNLLSATPDAAPSPASVQGCPPHRYGAEGTPKPKRVPSARASTPVMGAARATPQQKPHPCGTAGQQPNHVASMARALTPLGERRDDSVQALLCGKRDRFTIERARTPGDPVLLKGGGTTDVRELLEYEAAQQRKAPPTIHVPLAGDDAEKSRAKPNQPSFVERRAAEVLVLGDGELNPTDYASRPRTEREMFFEAMQRKQVKQQLAAKAEPRVNTYRYPSQVYAPVPRKPTEVLASRLDTSFDPTFTISANDSQPLDAGRFGLDNAKAPPSIVDRLQQDVAHATRMKSATQRKNNRVGDGGAESSVPAVTGGAIALDLPFTLAAPVAAVSLDVLLEWHGYLFATAPRNGVSSSSEAYVPLSTPGALSTPSRSTMLPSPGRATVASGASVVIGRGSTAKRVGGGTVEGMQKVLQTDRQGAAMVMAKGGLSKMLVDLRHKQHQQHAQQEEEEARREATQMLRGAVSPQALDATLVGTASDASVLMMPAGVEDLRMPASPMGASNRGLAVAELREWAEEHNPSLARQIDEQLAPSASPLRRVAKSIGAASRMGASIFAASAFASSTAGRSLDESNEMSINFGVRGGGGGGDTGDTPVTIGRADDDGADSDVEDIRGVGDDEGGAGTTLRIHKQRKPRAGTLPTAHHTAGTDSSDGGGSDGDDSYL